MEPYKKFIRSSYVKKFNHFLKSVVEPKFKKKYNKDIKLKLYGIGITPKGSVYEAIPKEELLDSQATVSFFIDTEPNHIRTNFIEDLILIDGKTFLQLQNGSYFGGEPEKFRLKIHFNNRPLYPLSYSIEDSLNEDLPFKEIEENGIKKRVFKENVNSHELKWHFDEKDRKVKIVKSNGWQIQLDDKLPRVMNEGETLFIPKGVYHRVIKGQGNLIVKIREY